MDDTWDLIHKVVTGAVVLVGGVMTWLSKRKNKQDGGPKMAEVEKRVSLVEERAKEDKENRLKHEKDDDRRFDSLEVDIKDIKKTHIIMVADVAETKTNTARIIEGLAELRKDLREKK